jgi:DNA polymerase-3 subunit delta
VAVIKANFLSSFSFLSDDSYLGGLVYGTDEGKIRSVVSNFISKNIGSPDDPFRIVELSDIDLKDDSARLSDEIRSVSFDGSKKLILVRTNGDLIFKTLSILERTDFQNFILVESGGLTKSSKLRNLFESSKFFFSMPIYANKSADTINLIRTFVKDSGLTITSEAERLLVSFLGSDHALGLSELEKLFVFLGDRKNITAQDVESACGDIASLNLDEFVDLVFLGKFEESDRSFERQILEGVYSQLLLTSLQRHCVRLQGYINLIEAGKSVDVVLKMGFPPLFFTRQDAVKTQLRKWSAERLLIAGEQIQFAISQSRKFGSLDDALCSRLVLALSRMAASL